MVEQTEVYKSNPYMNRLISISGPSAVGKSTVGKILAEDFDLPFYDLDDEVSKDAGFDTTQEVIRNLGHKDFKIIQNKCLGEITKNTTTKYVIASGGEINRPGYDQMSLIVIDY